MDTIYVRFEIEPFSSVPVGYAVCEFVDGLPTRQVSVVGDRLISSLSGEEDPEIGPTLTESALEEDWRIEEPELEEVDKEFFEGLWEQANRVGRRP
ncbi:hypothetical protein [Agromyces sp. NPDC049794]|uniref:hypothetical protein n=1 Tax=unclassified Agromyces TaxID=2639701 RepID=UPI0033D7A826